MSHSFSDFCRLVRIERDGKHSFELGDDGKVFKRYWGYEDGESSLDLFLSRLDEKRPVYERIVEFVVPKGVETIGDGAFVNRSSPTRIVLPKSVVKIGKGAFANRSTLRITILNESAQIEDDAFSGCGRLAIRAPGGSTAERFAKEKGYYFDSLDKPSSGKTARRRLKRRGNRRRRGRQ